MFEHVRRLEPMLGFNPLGPWLWLLIAIAVVGLVSWLVASAVMRRSGGAAGARGGAAGALDEADAILRARLARGEISADEYAETRRVLGLK